MTDNYAEFIKEFKKLIQKEKKSNKAIKAEITSITNNIIIVSTEKPLNLTKNMLVEVNRVSANVLQVNHKNIKLLLSSPENFKLYDSVFVHNIQKDVIIHKLEETMENIVDNKINNENKKTLNTLLNYEEATYNENHFKVSKKLNNNQRIAVKKSLQADKFHIIQGPPGTGKTHTIVEIIKQLHAQGKKILVTTHTHIALDNIIERLTDIDDECILRIGQKNKVSEDVAKYTLEEKITHHSDYKVIIQKKKFIEELKDDGSETSVNIFDKNNKSFLNKIFELLFSIKENENSLNNYINDIKLNKNIDAINEITLEIEKIKNNIQSDIVKNSNIIASTVLSSSSFLTKDVEFDYVIMDEASQVPVYLSLIPLMKTSKFILIGDNMQLQPIQNSNSSYFLNKSIFNLLINKYPNNYTFLNIQYRMNHEISDIASKLYYDGKLQTGNDVKNRRINLKKDNFLLLDDSPITFIDTSNVNFFETNVNGGCCNKYESKLILSIVKALLSNDISEDEIGVITPYKKQKLYIQQLFKKECLNIESDTIYRFQGREKDIIILCFCKSLNKSLSVFQRNFLADKNQLNVSITRSRKKLIIIGNYSMLKTANEIKLLIKEINPLNTFYLEDFLR